MTVLHPEATDGCTRSRKPTAPNRVSGIFAHAGATPATATILI